MADEIKSFAETLRSLRTNNNLTQRQLANKLFVERSTIAQWENGHRIPEPVLISRIANYFNIDASVLIGKASVIKSPNVIIIDNEKIFLSNSIPVIEEALPSAIVTGFSKSSEAVEFASQSRVALAFVDIELGKKNGFEVCRELIAADPMINVIFLTAYPEYSIPAWSTGACGFIVKPITAEAIETQLPLLRHPISSL
ncbi:MAG: response regulator [Firmicutes bacterium]|nr:response regulator [Bacillota bacterium]